MMRGIGEAVGAPAQSSRQTTIFHIWCVPNITAGHTRQSLLLVWFHWLHLCTLFELYWQSYALHNIEQGLSRAIQSKQDWHCHFSWWPRVSYFKTQSYLKWNGIKSKLENLFKGPWKLHAVKKVEPFNMDQNQGLPRRAPNWILKKVLFCWVDGKSRCKLVAGVVKVY